MDIEIRDAVNKEEWNSLLKQDDYSIFKTVEWSKISSDNSQYIVALNKSNLVGGLAFRKERVLFRKAFVTDSTPVALNNDIRVEILKFFKRLPGIKIINTTYQDTKFSKLLLKTGFKPTEKATVIIDLGKYGDVKNFLDKDSRYDINKAIKQNIKIVDASENNTEWEEFFKVYSTAGRHWGVRILNKKEFMKFKNLVEKNLAKLFLAKLNDKIVSGSIVLNSGNSVEFYINATNPEMKGTQANSLLVWEIMNYAKKNEFKYFDLFGYDLYAKKNEKTYGINKFKLSFGGEVKEFYKFTDSSLFVIARKLYNKIRAMKKIYFFLQRSDNI